MQNQQTTTLQKRKIALAVLSITLFALIPVAYAQGQAGGDQTPFHLEKDMYYHGEGCGRLVDVQVINPNLIEMFKSGSDQNYGEWIACHPFGDTMGLWRVESETQSSVQTITTYVSQEILEQPALSAPATWFFMIVVVIAGIGGFAIGFVVQSGNEEVSTLRFGDCEKIEINMKTGKVVATNVKEVV